MDSQSNRLIELWLMDTESILVGHWLDHVRLSCDQCAIIVTDIEYYSDKVSIFMKNVSKYVYAHF